MHPLIILAGPTASGKSELAVTLARHLQTEIISADSIQVYKHFDIGTAKPSQKLRQTIPHHLMDILNPDEDFTSFQFKQLALQQIRNLQAAGKPPILVGGTGLYIKTLVEGFECAVEVSLETSKLIKQKIKNAGCQDAYNELKNIDPEYAKKISSQDSQRIERALAVFYSTGKKFSEFHAENQKQNPDLDFFYFVLELERNDLYNRINCRVNDMIQKGFQKEVEKLLNQGWNKQLKPFQSIGYSQMISYLNGKISFETAIDKIKQETRRYAKRQITWFKKVPNAIPITVTTEDNPESLKRRILKHLPKFILNLAFIFFNLICLQSFAYSSSNDFNKAVNQFHEKKYHHSLKSLKSTLTAKPEKNLLNQSKFLLSKIYVENNNFLEAIPHQEELLNSFPELEDYILLDYAKTLWNSGKPDKALKQLELQLVKFPQSRLRPQVSFLRAELLTSMGKFKQALQQYKKLERLLKKRLPKNKYRESSLKIIKQKIFLYEKLNQPQKAYNLYRELYVNYPNDKTSNLVFKKLQKSANNTPSPASPLTVKEQSLRIRKLLNATQFQKALKEIKTFKKKSKDSFSAKLYFYLANAYQGKRNRAKANRVFLEYLKKFPRHKRVPEANYRIGKNLWNLGNPKEAIKYFEKTIQLSKRRGWKSASYFVLGRIYEDLKDYPNSIKNYQIVAKNYPKGKYGERAAWRIGWVYFKSGNLKKAYNQFKNNTKKHSKGSLIDKNLFWMGKVSEKLKKNKQSEKIYRKLFKNYPFTYYGFQAKDKINASIIKLKKYNSSSSLIRKASFEQQQRTKNILGRSLSKRENFHFSRAVHLIQLGFYSFATLELQALGKTIRKDFNGVLWLSYWFNQAHAYKDSFRVLQLYKNYKTKAYEKNLPLEFWVNFYPPAFSQTIDSFSKKYKVDPLLVKGLIRQESLYNTYSLSPAGARGLMQIMPKTGRRIFRQIYSSKNFDVESLFQPEINIELGIHYLSKLNQKHKNNKNYILINYNAGPKVLRAWKRRFRHLKDVDVFIESIPYTETRNYIKKVIRNLRTYKFLETLESATNSSTKSF